MDRCFLTAGDENSRGHSLAAVKPLFSTEKIAHWKEVGDSKGLLAGCGPEKALVLTGFFDYKEYVEIRAKHTLTYSSHKVNEITERDFTCIQHSNI